MEELAAKFHISKPQYGLCKVTAAEAGAPQIALISWVSGTGDGGTWSRVEPAQTMVERRFSHRPRLDNRSLSLENLSRFSQWQLQLSRSCSDGDFFYFQVFLRFKNQNQRLRKETALCSTALLPLPPLHRVI